MKTLLVTRCIIQTGLAMSLTACASQPYITADEWYTQSDHSVSSNEDFLPRTRYFAVPLTQRAKAVDLLKDQHMVQLSKAEVDLLLADTSQHFAERKHYSQLSKYIPYLVRAVDLSGGTNMYVSFNNGELSIVGAHYGWQKVPMYKNPIIVYLEQKPQRLHLEVRNIVF